jgi:hydroxymethylglutaryl-CoA lyase
VKSVGTTTADAVLVREVGLRDGLQMLAQFMPTPDKLAWIRAEHAAGVREIEVTSLVPARLAPQFADAEAVVREALALPGLCVVALVPNLRGAERAFELGVHKLDYVVSVSRTHNLRNVRREREASLEDLARIVRARDEAGLRGRVRVAAGLSTALGCSYEGRIAVDEVRRCAAALAEAGADEVAVADTVGYADPKLVAEVFTAVQAETGALPLLAHFHDTRGLGLANVKAALDVGVRAFDASLGGIGGCPHAPGATGNVSTEDLCFMLDALGLASGIDLPALLEVRQRLTQWLPGVALHGAVARAGLPTGWRPASSLHRVATS